MSYRPEGFDKKAKDILKKYSSVIDEDGVDYESIIEDTADAMLEALRKTCGVEIHNNETLKIPVRFLKCKIVVIPDDEEG
jgi:hypothetical protein